MQEARFIQMVLIGFDITKGFEPWTVTKIGNFEPPRTNSPSLQKVVGQNEAQREIEYYRKGSRWVGD